MLLVLRFLFQISLSMNCQPPKHSGRAAQIQTVFIALLFFPSFVGALSMVAFTVWRCDPFILHFQFIDCLQTKWHLQCYTLFCVLHEHFQTELLINCFSGDRTNHYMLQFFLVILQSEALKWVWALPGSRHPLPHHFQLDCFYSGPLWN